MLESECNVTLFFEEHLFAAEVIDGKIVSIDTRNARTSVESRFYSPIFIDCSGRASLGRIAGAAFRTGREAKSEFNESLAPDKADNLHHGNTLLFHTRKNKMPTSFPEVPWAVEVAKDFAELNGQMGGLGIDNQCGPCSYGSGVPKLIYKGITSIPSIARSIVADHRFPPDKVIDFFPGTHFWEYGQDLDMDENEEEIRDYLMRALYGTFYNVKNAQPKKYANLDFDWIHIVPARGEYCRLMGDYILNENEVREHAEFPDQIIMNDSAFCIHCAGNDSYDFRFVKNTTYAHVKYIMIIWMS